MKLAILFCAILAGVTARLPERYIDVNEEIDGIIFPAERKVVPQPEFVPIDDVKAEEGRIYKVPDNVTKEYVSRLIARLPESIINSKTGKYDEKEQFIISTLYENVDGLFQLADNEEVSFDKKIVKEIIENKQLVDVVEGANNVSYGVYLTSTPVEVITTTEKPTRATIRTRRPILLNDTLIKVFNPAPLEPAKKFVSANFINFSNLFNTIKKIIGLVKVIKNLLGQFKCFYICPPWRNRVCAYSPTHGYVTFKNNCVLKRDVCRGANFTYVKKGKC